MKENKKYLEGKKVTLVSILINTGLFFFKLFAGIVGHSVAIIADAIHSLSDLATDIAVIVGLKYSTKPQDEKHPYGHEKIETLVTLVLGFSLIAIGIKIGYDGIRRTFQPPFQSPTLLALFAALLSLVIKEIIYRYTLTSGRKIKSTAILANAWHHRSDAFSSFVALIGIGGSMLGIKILDPLCAVVLAFFIVHVGIKITKSTSLELIESSVDKKLIQKMEKIALLVPGVFGVHGIRARQIGSSVFAEIHIEVAKKMNVEDSHFIADEVERKIIENINNVKEVLVHVDPFLDENKKIKDTSEGKR